jgi:hypothetical protein
MPRNRFRIYDFRVFLLGDSELDPEFISGQGSE